MKKLIPLTLVNLEQLDLLQQDIISLTMHYPLKNENYGLIHVYGPEVHLSVANKTSIGVMASWIASPIALAFKQQIISYKNSIFNWKHHWFFWIY